MLAYYLLWHATERLDPLFAEQARDIEAGRIESKDRRWTVESVLETLMMRRRNTIECQGVRFHDDMAPTEDQAKLLALLRNPPPERQAAS